MDKSDAELYDNEAHLTSKKPNEAGFFIYGLTKSFHLPSMSQLMGQPKTINFRKLHAIQPYS